MMKDRDGFKNGHFFCCEEHFDLKAQTDSTVDKETKRGLFLKKIENSYEQVVAARCFNNVGIGAWLIHASDEDVERVLSCYSSKYMNFISFLAHHPDFLPTEEQIKELLKRNSCCSNTPFRYRQEEWRSKRELKKLKEKFLSEGIENTPINAL